MKKRKRKGEEEEEDEKEERKRWTQLLQLIITVSLHKTIQIRQCMLCRTAATAHAVHILKVHYSVHTG